MKVFLMTRDAERFRDLVLLTVVVSEEFGPGLLFESDKLVRVTGYDSVRGTGHNDQSGPDDQTDSTLKLPHFPCPNSLGGSAC